MTLSKQHLAALAEGRRKARTVRQDNAVDTLRAYRKWLLAGSPLGHMPQVPTDTQYELARDAGEPRDVLEARE